jgi:integrase
MYSEIKIYNPCRGKRGYVEVYIEGVRKRFASGVELGETCFPNKSKLTDAQRSKEFHRLATIVEAKLKKGWHPDEIIPKEQKGVLITVMQTAIKSFKASYKPRYVEDIVKYGNKFVDFLMQNGLSTLSTNQLEPMHVEQFLQAFQKSGSYHMTARSKLSAVLKKVKDLGYLKQNPVLLTSKRRVKAVLHEAYRADKIIKVLDYLNNNYNQLYFCALLMYGTLLRPHEEIRLLKRSHFDDDLTHYLLSGSENKGGQNRRLPLPEYVRVEMFRRDIHLMPSDYNIFRGCREPYNRWYFSTMWTRAKVDLLRLKLINEKQTLYSFRHSASVSVFNATQQIKLLQQLLGHQSVVTTEIYLRSIGVIEVDISMLPKLSLGAVT